MILLKRMSDIHPTEEVLRFLIQTLKERALMGVITNKREIISRNNFMMDCLQDIDRSSARMMCLMPAFECREQ